MSTIKFSYPLSKLFHNNSPIDHARLLQVIEVDLSDITQELRDFDTDHGKYPLPAKGAYLLLILQKARGAAFTTLRRSTPEKLAYYRGRVGDLFHIEINYETHINA